MPRRLRFHVPVPPLGQHLPPRLLRPVAWRPLTDAEWELARPFVTSLQRRGRPVLDLRARLDACLHGACMAGPWRELPEAYGKADTISRQSRRWAEAGLWDALLHALARHGRALGMAGLLYFVCRAFRRAHRTLGVAGLRLARALGMDTALRAPRQWLDDPDLSEHYHATVLLPGLETLLELPAAAKRQKMALWKVMLASVTGRPRIARWMAPA